MLKIISSDSRVHESTCDLNVFVDDDGDKARLEIYSYVFDPAVLVVSGDKEEMLDELKRLARNLQREIREWEDQ